MKGRWEKKWVSDWWGVREWKNCWCHKKEEKRKERTEQGERRRKERKNQEIEKDACLCRVLGRNESMKVDLDEGGKIMSESVTYKFLLSSFLFFLPLVSSLHFRNGWDAFLSVIYVCMCKRQTMLLMSCVRTRELEPPQAKEWKGEREGERERAKHCRLKKIAWARGDSSPSS